MGGGGGPRGLAGAGRGLAWGAGREHAGRGPGPRGKAVVLSSRSRMRYVASYLLAALGGNTSPSAKDIKKILDSVGIEADDDRLNKVAGPADTCRAAGGGVGRP